MIIIISEPHILDTLVSVRILSIRGRCLASNKEKVTTLACLISISSDTLFLFCLIFSSLPLCGAGRALEFEIAKHGFFGLFLIFFDQQGFKSPYHEVEVC